MSNENKNAVSHLKAQSVFQNKGELSLIVSFDEIYDNTFGRQDCL